MPDADFWHPAASRSVCAWRTWPTITHQAETTNSKTEEGIFQGDERGDSEKAQSRDRAISHVPADFRSNAASALTYSTKSAPSFVDHLQMLNIKTRPRLFP